MKSKKAFLGWRKPKYIREHPEIVLGHVIGVGVLTVVATTLVLLCPKMRGNALIIFLIVGVIIEMLIEHICLADAKDDKREFASWKRNLKKHCQKGKYYGTLIPDYEVPGMAMIVGKIGLPKGKSLYYVTPKFRYRVTENTEVEVDIWFVPGDKLTYVRRFRKIRGEV